MSLDNLGLTKEQLAQINQEILRARHEEARRAYLISADEPNADIISKKLKTRLAELTSKGEK